MNVVAMRSVNPDSRTLPAFDGRIARLDIFDDIGAAESYWRAVAGQHLRNRRTYEFLKLWHCHVGADTGVSPFIVVAFNATGTPLFLWPFGTRKVAGLRLAEFLGGKHANFNMALWRRDIAATIGVDACVPCSHA
jgi:CelD/BcsL family acetyltransferase involved in cellulose biosynthesis